MIWWTLLPRWLSCPRRERRSARATAFQTAALQGKSKKWTIKFIQAWNLKSARSLGNIGLNIGRHLAKLWENCIPLGRNSNIPVQRPSPLYPSKMVFNFHASTLDDVIQYYSLLCRRRYPDFTCFTIPESGGGRSSLSMLDVICFKSVWLCRGPQHQCQWATVST